MKNFKATVQGINKLYSLEIKAEKRTVSPEAKTVLFQDSTGIVAVIPLERLMFAGDRRGKRGIESTCRVCSNERSSLLPRKYEARCEALDRTGLRNARVRSDDHKPIPSFSSG